MSAVVARQQPIVGRRLSGGERPNLETKAKVGMKRRKKVKEWAGLLWPPSVPR